MFTKDGVTYQFKRLYRCVEISRAMLDKPNGNFKHFSFVMKGSQILSIGWNDISAPPIRINKKLIMYPLGGVHSELHSIKKIKNLNCLKDCSLVNVRLNRKGQLRLSKPCNVCMTMITLLKFNKLYYSTEFGFTKGLKIAKM